MVNNVILDINEALNNPGFYFALFIFLVVILSAIYLYNSFRNKETNEHDHTKCPNYATCQELQKQMNEKANYESLDRAKREMKDDVSRELTNFKELILEKFISINDKMQILKEDMTDIKEYIRNK